jgi:hypothetical protein
MSSIMRRRSGLISAISLLLFQRLRFNSRNPSKQKPHPQTVPPNAASAASFNPLDSDFRGDALEGQGGQDEGDHETRGIGSETADRAVLGHPCILEFCHLSAGKRIYGSQSTGQ